MMKAEEAKDVLERYIECGNTSCLDDKPSCDGCVLKIMAEEWDNALDMAIEALEKQIPEKPTEEAHDEKALSYNLYCPACERVIGYRGTITGRIAQKYGNEDYCGKCGQAIDWSEDEV
jgi:hypothetical protein